jgi:hypothetical protein
MRFPTARLRGLTLALGALALTPLIARAEVAPDFPDEWIDRPCLVISVGEDHSAQVTHDPNSTVVILGECPANEYADPDAAAGTAGYAGQGLVDPRHSERVIRDYLGWYVFTADGQYDLVDAAGTADAAAGTAKYAGEGLVDLRHISG